MPVAHYASISDVNLYVPQSPFSPTSKPNDTVVIGFLQDVANDMDMVLANIGYVVPVVAGPLALQWLRKTCAIGTLGIAQAARDTGVTTAVNASGREVKNIWQQMFDARMKALCDAQDPTELADAARTGEQIEKQGESVLRSSVQSVDDSNWLTPNVTREQVL